MAHQPDLRSTGQPGSLLGDVLSEDPASAVTEASYPNPVFRACAIKATKGTPWARVSLGHPDTGYRKHPEIAGNLLAGQGFDRFRNDQDPQPDGKTSGR